MTVFEMQRVFIEDASRLGDYQLMTKTQLANGYCDADEAAQQAKAAGDMETFNEKEALRSAYHSALMLRYWYKIFEWNNNSATLNLELSDFVDWLYDSLYVAFYYRAWRYEFKAVVKEGKFIEYKLDEDGNKIRNDYYYVVDTNAPDKIINRCCGSMRGRVFQYHNKHKRKVNTQTYSLDNMIEDEGDYAAMFAGGYSYDSPSKSQDDAYSLVQALLNRGESLEALIIESIAYHDAFKEEKVTKVVTNFNEETGASEEYKYTTTVSKFNPRKLVKHLNTIGEEFIYNFCESYNINNTVGTKLLSRLKSLNNNKLYKAIEKTLEEIRQSPDLLKLLSIE